MCISFCLEKDTKTMHKISANSSQILRIGVYNFVWRKIPKLCTKFQLMAHQFYEYVFGERYRKLQLNFLSLLCRMLISDSCWFSLVFMAKTPIDRLLPGFLLYSFPRWPFGILRICHWSFFSKLPYSLDFPLRGNSIIAGS